MKQRNTCLSIKLRILVICLIFLGGVIVLLQASEIIRGERPYINLYNVPNEAMEKSWIRIKFQVEMTDHLDNTEIIKDERGIIVFGIPLIDELNQYYNVHTAIMLFDSPALNHEFDWRHRLWEFHLWYELHFDSEEDIREIIMAYRGQDSIVNWAEPEYKKELYSGTLRWVPDDPYIEQQWHYSNTGQYGGTPGADISLYEAWDIEKGNDNVIVAIIDGGIDTSHVDLSGNMWSGIGFNFVNDTPEISPHDHGTHVAGTVSAVNNNGFGVAGIAGGSGENDGAQLMSCQVFTAGGSGGFHTAFTYAADNGAAIAQNSWGTIYPGVYEQVVLDAIDYFYNHGGGYVMNGGIIIFAAGNSNSDGEYYPGYYERSFAVAATNDLDIKASYSNYGSWIDISAPGGEMAQSIWRGVFSTSIGDGYVHKQGTSMACPHVSGVAALVLSFAYRNGIILENSQLWDILENAVDDHYAENPNYLGQLGSGRLNAYKALMEFPDFLFGGGAGTQEDPWWVETDQHLKYVRHFLGFSAHHDKYFIQKADIDLNVPPWNQNQGWIPIGTQNSPFSGSYNGNGFLIKNLFIDSDSAYVGLFGDVFNAEIVNLALENIVITGTGSVGGLVGRNRYVMIPEPPPPPPPPPPSRSMSLVENCYSTGNISTQSISSPSGGLVGRNIGGTIRRSFSTVNVSGNSVLGGLVGQNHNGLITNSNSMGYVHGDSYLGGLIGYNQSASSISNCYSTGYLDVSGVGLNVGGLIGYNQGTINNCYWNIESSGQTSSAAGTGLTTLEMVQSINYNNWNFDEIWEIVDFSDLPYIRKHYPVLQWQEDSFSHNRIENAHIHRYKERQWQWRAFPRLEEQDNHTYTVELLAPLAGNINRVDSMTGYMEWNTIDELWEISLEEVAFNSLEGFKLRFSDRNEYFLYAKGPRIEDNSTITLEPFQENWVGYFLPNTQSIFIAIPQEVMGQIHSIKTDEWGMYRRYDGSWIGYQSYPCYTERQVSYGKMYVIETNVSIPLTLQWASLQSSQDPPPRLPPVKYFVFDEKPDYESFFIEYIENDEDVLEVAVLAGDVCVGASVFLGGYPLEILAYTDESHYGEEISFVILRDDKREEPERIRIPKVMNIEDGEYLPRIIKPKQQKFTVVRLGKEDYETETVLDPELSLSQNYPNPYVLNSAKHSNLTEIPFYVSEEREVALNIYNIKGQLVKNLHSGKVTAGKHSISWNGMNEQNRRVGSGVYFYRLESGDTVITRKMLIIR